MSRLVSFIVGPIAGYVFGGLLIASLLGHGVSWAVNHFEFADMLKQRDDALAMVREEQRQSGMCVVSVAQLDASLNRNIAQIKEWQKQGEDSTRRAEEGQETVRKTVAAVRASVAKLLSATPVAPVGTFEACKAGVQVLRGGVP